MRRRTRVINVGGVKIGGKNPVSIQSMTKVKTSNIAKTVKQIRELERMGCELIRVSVKDTNDAKAIRQIKKRINIPLIADIHFNFRLAIESIKNGADKIRINPGNISKTEDLKEIIKLAKKHKIPIRIGINSGSLPREVRNTGNEVQRIVRFARKYLNFFERQNFRDIIISLKSSSVSQTVDAYRAMAKLCDYPFHLGVTAAGSYDSGIVKSSIGIGALLLDGIGDTIRVSLTGDSVEEVTSAKRILKALGLRNFGPDIISCPTCGRCQVGLIKVAKDLEKKLSSKAVSNLGKRKNSKPPITIAVMGCEVNGPGEAGDADIGIAFGKKKGMLFKKGKILKRVKTKNAVQELLKILKS